MPGVLEKFGFSKKGEIEKEKNHEMIEEIDTLREPLQKILEQLRPHLETGEYQLLVGDDASGRIPTLILRRVIRGIYKERGYPTPKTIFFAGRKPWEDREREDKLEGIQRYTEHTIQSLGDAAELKGLIITDTIATGDSVKIIGEGLQRAGISSDVATVSLYSRSIEEVENQLGCKVFFGKRGVHSIYSRREFSGVEKEWEDVFASTFSKEELKENVNVELRSRDGVFARSMSLQESISIARENVKQLSDELIEWYKQQK